MDSLRRIPQLLARQRRRLALAGAARLALLLVAAHLAFLAVAGFLSVRQPLSEDWLRALAGSYAAYLLLPAFILVAWRRKANAVESVARDLDHANPDAPDPFRTSLSLGSHGEETRRELDRLFAAHLPRLVLPAPRFFPRAQRAALAVAALAFLGAALASGGAGDFLRRTAAPWAALRDLPILRFAVAAPPAAIGVGDTLRLRGTVAHRLPDQPVYAHVRTSGGETRHPLKLAGAAAAGAATAGESFTFDFGPIEGDFTVQLAAANGRSAAWRVRALPPPFLASLRAVVTPPAYTRLRPDTLPPGMANFPVLPGSRVRFEAAADRDLAAFAFESRDSAGVRRDSLGAGRTFAVEREVRIPMDYAFDLADAQGIRSRREVPGRIDLLPDHPPEVELLDPAEDRTLDRDLKLPLAFRVKDDFGLTSLALVWRLLSDGAVKDEGRRDGRDWLQRAAAGLVEAEWDMQALQLRPENVLEIHLEATDNDTVNGPKTARSAVRSLRMPSVQEVLAASRRQEQEAMASLKSAIEREKQLERRQERETRSPREEGPPALAGYEINRIMVDSPREQALRAQAALDHAGQALSRRQRESGKDASRKDPGAREAEARAREAVREMQEFLDRSREALPQGNQAALPLEERRRNLEELMKAQKEQEKKLAQLKEKLAKAPGKEELPRAQMEFSAQELKRNLEAQSDLQRHFQEEAYQERARKESAEQGSQERMRLAEDMKKALDDIEKTMEQGRKNGLLDKDLMDKMEKIQELLKEVLPDSLQKLMEQKMAGQEVDPRELRDQMQKLLGKQGELGENLSRALAMLEQLRDRKRLQELKQGLAELESRERDLAHRLQEGKGGAQALEAEQKAIQQDLKKSMEDFAAQSKGRKPLEEAARDLQPAAAQKDMQAVRDALSPPSSPTSPSQPSRSQASASAKDAADKLVAMQSSLAQSMAAMEGAVDIAEAHTLLKESLALSRLQLLVRTGAGRRSAEGWQDDEPVLRATVARTAQWLGDRARVFAGSIPFFGAALVSEARNLQAAAREASEEYTYAAAEKALHHNQNLSRELLKLIKMAQGGGGGGGGGGQGDGESSAQNGQQPGGQGQGGGGGQGDLSGQLKGMSGKQMAINQATQQLLKAMMEGRRMGSGSSGRQPGGEEGMGGMPGGEGGEGGEGQMGMQGPEGGQEGPGGRQGRRGREGQGSGGEGGGGQEGTLQGLGNRQGELGESLESLAEALAEEGDGARKVRKLAEEARQLEDDMRQGRLTPEEIRKRQERFQSRMLEAANALEERGQSEQRKAETSRGSPGGPPETSRAAEGRLIRLLREARRDAKTLRLDEAQRRALEDYYESLLTR